MSAPASSPRTGQVGAVIDASRRPDVLLRRRRPDGYRVNAWWLIGSFVVVSVGVVALLNFFPSGY